MRHIWEMRGSNRQLYIGGQQCGNDPTINKKMGTILEDEEKRENGTPKDVKIKARPNVPRGKTSFSRDEGKKE